jgi:hypothetical protein
VNQCATRCNASGESSPKSVEERRFLASGELLGAVAQDGPDDVLRAFAIRVSVGSSGSARPGSALVDDRVWCRNSAASKSRGLPMVVTQRAAKTLATWV